MVIRESATKKFHVVIHADDFVKNCRTVVIDAGNVRVWFGNVPRELADDTEALKKDVADRLIDLAEFVKG